MKSNSNPNGKPSIGLIINIVCVNNITNDAINKLESKFNNKMMKSYKLYVGR